MNLKFERMDFSESIEHHIAEHELLLSFYDAIGAEAFHTWWYVEASALFRQWCESSEEFKEAIK